MSSDSLFHFKRIWKDMSLNDSMNEVERSKLAVWDYPVSDKYTKIWQSMQVILIKQLANKKRFISNFLKIYWRVGRQFAAHF